jgi:hypothetical protein
MAAYRINEENQVTAAPHEPIRSRKPKLTYILVGLVALLAVLSVVIATRPGEFRVARSATMPAAPAAVFAQVNDFHKWEAWSPWAKLDPDAKSTFEGPTAGTGAIFRWDGNGNVGAGSMKITESRPSDLIRIQLDFIRPFAGTNDVEFTFKPQGDQTNVTWSMAGKNNFIAKAIGLVMDCEKMIGGNFEQGLAGIKSVVEKDGRP